LSHVLFSGEELEFIDETRELSNSILKNIYFQFAPGNIADVILDSCLNQYDEVRNESKKNYERKNEEKRNVSNQTF